MKLRILAIFLMSLFLFNCSAEDNDATDDMITEDGNGDDMSDDDGSDDMPDDGGDMSDDEDDMPDDGGITLINYTDDVEPILVGNCYNCHGEVPTNGTSTSFFTYAEVVNFSEEISNRINARGNNNSMPPGGLLNSDIIAVIDQWIIDGLLEN